jgi:hypothetical protein
MDIFTEWKNVDYQKNRLKWCQLAEKCQNMNLELWYDGIIEWNLPEEDVENRERKLDTKDH